MTDNPPKPSAPESAPPPPRKPFDIHSPYDKPSLSERERKAYERKIMNIGLVVIMLVIAAMAIALHQFFSGLGTLGSDAARSPAPPPHQAQDSRSRVPSPVQIAPPAAAPQPTRIETPGRPDPQLEPIRMEGTATIAGVGTLDGAPVMYFDYIMPDTGRPCSYGTAYPEDFRPLIGATVSVAFTQEDKNACPEKMTVFYDD